MDCEGLSIGWEKGSLTGQWDPGWWRKCVTGWGYGVNASGKEKAGSPRCLSLLLSQVQFPYPWIPDYVPFLPHCPASQRLK